MTKIRTIKQIERLATSMFPCYVQDGSYGDHALGYRKIRLIVGKKKNASYDPEAKSGANSRKTEPDVRIIYVKGGEDESVLIKKLTAIKKSLEIKKQDIDPEITGIESPVNVPVLSAKEEADIAEKVASGESPDAMVVDDFEDDDGFEDDRPQNAPSLKDDEKLADKLSSEPQEQEVNPIEEFGKSLEVIANNTNVLAKDVKTIAKKQDKQGEQIKEQGKQIKKLQADKPAVNDK